MASSNDVSPTVEISSFEHSGEFTLLVEGRVAPDSERGGYGGGDPDKNLARFTQLYQLTFLHTDDDLDYVSQVISPSRPPEHLGQSRNMLESHWDSPSLALPTINRFMSDWEAFGSLQNSFSMAATRKFGRQSLSWTSTTRSEPISDREAVQRHGDSRQYAHHDSEMGTFAYPNHGGLDTANQCSQIVGPSGSSEYSFVISYGLSVGEYSVDRSLSAYTTTNKMSDSEGCESDSGWICMVGTHTPRSSGALALFAAPYTRALPRELVDLIFHLVRHASERAITQSINIKTVKKEVVGLSLVCRRWSLLLRPFLFRRLQLCSRSDIQFLASVVRSPLSAWLAAHIDTIRLNISKEKKDVGPIQLSSSEWRDLRAAAPALKTLHFEGFGQMFPWRQRDGLRTLTTLRSITISYFRFPSVSSLLRLISNTPSLEEIALICVTWSGSGTPHGYPTAFSNLKVVNFLGCTNTRFAAWIFAAAAARWTPARRESPIPLTASTIMEVSGVFFDDQERMVVEKVCDRDDDDYTFCATSSSGGSIAFAARPLLESNGERADHFRVLRRVAFSMDAIKEYLPSHQPQRLEARTQQLKHKALLDLVVSCCILDTILRTTHADSQEGIKECPPSDRLPPVNSETRTECLESWASLNRALSQLVHLQSIDLFCGTADADSEEDFNKMVSETCSLLPEVGTKVHGIYSATVRDGRDLAPELFGSKWPKSL